MSKKDKDNEPDINVDMATEMYLTPEKFGLTQEQGEKILGKAMQKAQDMDEGKEVGYAVVAVIPDRDAPENKGRKVPVSFTRYAPIIGRHPEKGYVELPIFLSPQLAIDYMKYLASDPDILPRADEGQTLVAVGMTMEKIADFAERNRVTHIRSYGTAGYSSLTTWPGGQFVERTPIEW